MTICWWRKREVGRERREEREGGEKEGGRGEEEEGGRRRREEEEGGRRRSNREGASWSLYLGQPTVSPPSKHMHPPTPHAEAKGSGYNTTSRPTLEGRNQMKYHKF